VNRLPFIHPTREDLAAAHARGKTAGDLMSRELATARGDARVSDAIAAMLPGRQKVLAVTDGEGHLLGVVDRADLLHALVPGSPHSG
jgi:CBS domain-containing protein